MPTGDGFVDYARGAETGLANQGWKDSEDSVFDADGPRRRGSDRAGRGAGLRLRGVPGHGRSRGAARRGATRATPGAPRPSALRRRSRSGSGSRSWAPTPWRSTATASLAGCARPTPGICCSPACLRRNAAGAWRDSCSAPPSTPAGASARWRRGEPRYNPMSYHNGSVWPHDTAMCAAGLARYGARDGAAAPAERHVRDRGQVRHAPAGAVLRLRAAARRAADRLSRRLPAAGLGVGLGVHDAAGLPRPRPSTAGAARSTSTARGCRPGSTG